MVDYNLKNKIESTYKLIDDVQNSNPSLTLSTGMTLREMLKYNLLQYVGFLFESDGTDGRLELDFIREYLGTYMSISQFLNFKYGKCMDKEFINTPPRCLLYIIKSDLTDGSVKSPAGRPIAKEVVDLYKDLGAAFVAINGETVTEVGNLSNYSLMLDDFLKQYGLYFTDGIGGKRNPKNKNYRKNDITNKTVNSSVNKTNASDNKINAANAMAAEGLKVEPEETLEQLKKELEVNG